MSQTASTTICQALRQMPRATAFDIREDYREVSIRLKRLADNLAGAFVVAHGEAANALEVELRTFEEALDIVASSMLPQAIDEGLPGAKS